MQEEVKSFLRESDRGRTRPELSLSAGVEGNQMTQEDLEEHSRSHLELEKRAELVAIDEKTYGTKAGDKIIARKEALEGRTVDVVLSDMSEPWAQTDGFWKRSLSDPYYRMMNTSGMSFRDHAGSMVKRHHG